MKAFGRDRRYPITTAFRKVGLSGQGRVEQERDPAAERTAGPGRAPAPGEGDR